MNAPAATQAGVTLTKPTDWALYMVTAALKCASDEKLPLLHATLDEARHAVLKTLNWFEAHDEYDWTDYCCLNYDFSQVMRLRRALVQDVVNALQQAGNIKTGVPGTPDSLASGRRIRRSHSAGGRRANTRKRLCKREAEADEDAMSETSEIGQQDDSFLLDVMSNLIGRSKVDVAGYVKEKRDSHELADILHANLVEVRDRSQQEIDYERETLQQKEDICDRHKSSILPRPSQREQTTTPRVGPVAPQTSPTTVQKPASRPPPALRST